MRACDADFPWPYANEPLPSRFRIPLLEQSPLTIIPHTRPGSGLRAVAAGATEPLRGRRQRFRGALCRMALPRRVHLPVPPIEFRRAIAWERDFWLSPGRIAEACPGSGQKRPVDGGAQGMCL